MGVKQGYIKENENGNPMPNVNVVVFDETGQQVDGTTTNTEGFFKIDGYLDETLQISHTGYKPVTIYLDGGDESFTVSMVKNEINLPPVVVKASGKNYLWLLALVPLAFIKDEQKKVAGLELNAPTVVAVGIGILFIKGFGFINTILEMLGLKKSQEDVNFENEQSNPYSAFNPNFWKYGQDQGNNVMILTVGSYESLKWRLIESFYAINDNEAQAIGVFTGMKTKSQVSFFAYMWQQEGRGDLLQYLQGNEWPDDRLSTEEVNQIINYVKKLPNYMP